MIVCAAFGVNEPACAITSSSVVCPSMLYFAGIAHFADHVDGAAAIARDDDRHLRPFMIQSASRQLA